jgi:hypothetical protein
MRWKIIVINALIVLVVGVLSYALLATSLSDLVKNPTERKTNVAQALRAANSQLALDALRLESWLAEKASSEGARGVFAAGTPEARSEAATAEANRLRDAAVREFPKMAPALVLFVDRQGIALGRNGSALMRGDKTADAYPSLGRALGSGHTMSAIWLNRQRQEQMLVSYAPAKNDDGAVIGAIVIGTPLTDERMARTSELTSGHYLALALLAGDRLELVAASQGAEPAGADAVGSAEVRQAAAGALSSGNVATTGEKAEHVFGAAPLTGYVGEPPAVLIGAVPASLVGTSLFGLLWPLFGISVLGIVLVAVAGVLLANYYTRPIAELEDGLLAIINGKNDLRFQIEHPELGGLVFRINSLLNALMGVPEDTTDDQGRKSMPAVTPAAFEQVEEGAVAPEVARSLATEPAGEYYARLFREYLAAKREIGEPVEHITEQAFVAHIQQNETQTAQRVGRPVRYQVRVRDAGVVLVAIPLPS